MPQRAKLISTYQESRENRHPILYITTRNKEEGKGEEDKDDEGIGGTTTIMDEENNSNTSNDDQLQVLLFIALQIGPIFHYNYYYHLLYANIYYRG